MAITRAQQAKQLLNKIAPKGERLAYINSREAKLLKKMGGAGKDINGTGIKSYMDPGVGPGSVSESLNEAADSLNESRANSGGGGGGNYTPLSIKYSQIAAAKAKAEAQAEEIRQEEIKQQKIINNAVEQARINPFGKTFVDRGYVNPSTFDVKAAANRPPPVYQEEEKSLLDKGIGLAKTLGKGAVKNVGMSMLDVPYPSLTGAVLGFAFSKAREDKAKRDAIDAKISDARLSGSFYTGPVNPTRTTRPDVTPDGDNDNLIPRPFMIQPNREVIEEEPTPYDFDLYAARDNRVARRFAQGGRTGFNMGGMEEENLQAGAPDLRLEGNQVPQQEEMASAPGIDAELYQLFLDALRKGDVPQGTTFDAYKQLMMQAMSEQQGEQMQEQEMMQPEMQEGIMQAQMMEPEREMAAFGGMMGSDGRRAYGLGSFFKKAARTVKKVFKSDIGKAALIGLAGYGIGGGRFGIGGAKFSKETLGANLNPMRFFKNSQNDSVQKLRSSLSLDSDNAYKIISNPKSSPEAVNQALKNLDVIQKRAEIAKSTGALTLNKNTGISQGMNLAATIGIPAVMAAVYSQGKADEKPMDENTLARIDQYNNPLFEEGIGGRRAKILAGDNTGMNFIGQNDIYRSTVAQGGRIGANEGGLMNLGGNEMDLRGGGFVPLGAKEKADDVPARLSKNEFVFTADAVRAAGGGSVDKGAEKMYNTMKRLEGVVA
jgi:hypothetical protein